MTTGKPETKDWTAFEQTKDVAGHGRHILVSGSVHTHRSNEKPKLSKATTQGIVPSHLVLNLTVAIDGGGNDVEQDITVTYTEDNVAPGQFTHVEIMHGKDKITTIKVVNRPS